MKKYAISFLTMVALCIFAGNAVSALENSPLVAGIEYASKDIDSQGFAGPENAGVFRPFMVGRLPLIRKELNLGARLDGVVSGNPDFPDHTWRETSGAVFLEGEQFKKLSWEVGWTEFYYSIWSTRQSEGFAGARWLGMFVNPGIFLFRSVGANYQATTVEVSGFHAWALDYRKTMNIYVGDKITSVFDTEYSGGHNNLAWVGYEFSPPSRQLFGQSMTFFVEGLYSAPLGEATSDRIVQDEFIIKTGITWRPKF